MDKPRVYIAIATFHPLIGGAEKQALMQGRCLRARGIEATVLTFHHDSSWPVEEEIEGLPIIRVGGKLLHHRKRFPRPCQKLLYLIALIFMGWSLWLRRQHFDILHIYHLNLMALPAALACWLAHKPMIAAIRSTGSGISTHQSLLAGSLDPYLPFLRVPGRIKTDNDLEDLERLGKPIVRLTHALLLHIQAVIVVLSSRMLDYPSAHNFSLPNIQLIPNGIDITRFQPRAESIPAEEIAWTVICVARLSYEKGIDVLLQAWHLVHNEAPQARLLIVGDGPLFAQLQCMAQELDISHCITFAGTQHDIPAQLHRGSIAVLPSRSEGMPNAILEAMACGIPCVATRVSGSEDIIQHGKNGLLVDVYDYQAMAQAILTLLHDPERTHRYGRAARERIEQAYALDHITDQYIALYQRIFQSSTTNISRKKVTQQCAE
ncbi:MAG TPA: glycosyltransferase family 4 protein [Ktedonobacteraceae bacterium]|nr:glycosyltransferase family 4 protein [Ktedonobacteraceae bacterium]